MRQATTPALRLRSQGQSVWIDELSRDMIESGQLAALRDEGVSGVTDNPTTFDRAISKSDAYDQDIRTLGRGLGPPEIAWELLLEDVRRGADVLRPAYDESAGTDGFVSIEVSPDLAYDTVRTIEAARELWRRCDRPNVMIKVPGTEAGLPAISRLVAEGVNVNVTLVFSVPRHVEVMDAFMTGLEVRHAGAGDLERVASVVSFFVSRIDAKVDGLLRERSEQGGEEPTGSALLGAAGIASCRLAHGEWRRAFSSPRWERLRQAGARPQLCLWASTSVKDPAYRPTMYVEALSGPDTVVTMPLKTYGRLHEADLDHPRLEGHAGVAAETHARLAALGIDIRQVTGELESEGVEAFGRSFSHAVRSIGEKIDARGWSPVDAASDDSFPASDPPSPSGGGPQEDRA